MAMKTYSDQEIADFLVIAQDIGIGRAIRQLGYPASWGTAQRWAKMRGITVEVDDLKAVTSGRWLRRPTAFEETISGCAVLLSYAAPSLAANATLTGQIIIALLLLGNAAALACANYLTTALCMKGKTLQIQGAPRAYERRSILANELIAESGRSDWAVAMGLIPGEPHSRNTVTM